MVVSAAHQQLLDIRSRLAKRATFEQATSDLIALCCASGGLELADAVLEVVDRAFTLLKTRYTAVPFWQSGRKLMRAAQVLATTTEQRSKLASYIHECDECLGDVPTSSDAGEPAAAAAAARGYLFEGQLSTADEAPPRPRGGLEDILSLLATQARTAAEQQGEAGAEPGLAFDEARVLEAARLQQALEDAGLEEALLASMAENGERPGGPPPAAKTAVKALVREVLTDERLHQIGGPGVQCAVCREDLKVGDEVQIMPCNDSHVYHPPCLAPWLTAHNSCPVCRFELPTDDTVYERRKEREKIEAEDRKGADNALSHNEFMYI
ncbi:hypothetical protein WJX72_003607 [[Myrmecia] bisecta]|uniref:RING-type E3 ubiquitin transferase n=1 Tax=[Myrmecia] bisecta TaxID=41462 RepID=A0AAW1QEN4_9CHLO